MVQCGKRAVAGKIIEQCLRRQRKTSVERKEKVKARNQNTWLFVGSIWRWKHAGFDHTGTKKNDSI